MKNKVISEFIKYLENGNLLYILKTINKCL